MGALFNILMMLLLVEDNDVFEHCWGQGRCKSCGYGGFFVATQFLGALFVISIMHTVGFKSSGYYTLLRGKAGTSPAATVGLQTTLTLIQSVILLLRHENLITITPC